MTRYHCDWAWLGAATAVRDVVLDVVGPNIATISTGPRQAGDVHLRGLTLPGFVNTHSHAFHRVLRGQTGRVTGFWSWRDVMYAVAERLDPDNYYALARAVYAEMLTSGITTAGEFHYVHHPPGGGRYGEPNAMGTALRAAADDVGLRLTLLDALYLTADIDGSPVSGVQRRFSDGSVDGWLKRTDSHNDVHPSTLAYAVHSVRAVPASAMREVAGYAQARGRPLHIHLSEQQRENQRCVEVTGRTPAALVAEANVLSAATTAVHATHVTDDDIELLARTGTRVCLCPTTERVLADGVGPARLFAAAGIPIALGTDSQAVIDVFEEMRAVELDERLLTGRGGYHPPAALLAAATTSGARALGRPDAGLAAGAPADFVTLRLDSPRTAGVADPLAAAVFAATAADVAQVVVAGRITAEGGQHVDVDVTDELATSIAALVD
jgi:formiminoglutamate deiminase